MHQGRIAAGLLGFFLSLSTQPTTFVHAAPVSSSANTTDAQYDSAIKQLVGNSGRPQFGSPTFTCRVLDIAFGSNVVTLPGNNSAAYQLQTEVNYSETCWLDPACIVNPRTTAETARVIRIIGQLQTKFAIRSGGHKSAPGFASIDSSGVLISLSKLTTLSLAGDKKSVVVGTGNRWEAVYDLLTPQGLTAVGGRVGSVGVGGFLLGGGVSFVTNEHGLGVDNIKSFEVVLSNGNIVTASATKNKDLYKGLRGGAANFGIVTTFELFTHPLGEITLEARFYGLNQSHEALRALAAYQNSPTGQKADPFSRIDLTISGTGVTVLLLYTKPIAGGSVQAFQPFYDIVPYTPVAPPMNTTLTTLLMMQKLAFPNAHTRAYGGTLSHTADSAFMVDSYQIFLAESAKLPAGATASWVPIAVPASVAANGAKKNGGNLLGLSAVPQVWHEWHVDWKNAADDEKARGVAQGITVKLAEAARKKGVLLPYLFMNTAGLEQNVLAGFGRRNVDEMKTVARRYDGAGVFQRLQNDGYLLRDV